MKGIFVFLARFLPLEIVLIIKDYVSFYNAKKRIYKLLKNPPIEYIYNKILQKIIFRGRRDQWGINPWGINPSFPNITCFPMMIEKIVYPNYLLYVIYQSRYILLKNGNKQKVRTMERIVIWDNDPRFGSLKSYYSQIISHYQTFLADY